MAVKQTLLGLFIYVAMLGHVSAFAALACRARKLGTMLYAAGFAAAAAALISRWFQVGHVPLQNLFEVFLCLGTLSWPLSLFCQRFLKIRVKASDALMGFIVLFPAGFIFEAEPQMLPPALQSWLFAPHVGAYLLAYVILLKATVEALGHLFSPGSSGTAKLAERELATYRTVRCTRYG